MSMNIDKPLDEIIATNKTARRGRGRRGRTGPRSAGPGNTRAGVAPNGTKIVGAKQQQQTPAQLGLGAAPTNPGAVVGDKIIVSNLPDDVTEAQIKDLFQSTVGPLKTAKLSYDSKGKSTGVATVVFHKAPDAQKAYQQYNKRLVDGKRPMRVEIVYDPSKAPPAPLTSRLNPLPVSASATVAAAGGSARQNRQVSGTAGARGGRGGRGGGRGGRAGGERRPKATAESLDAEMTEYLNQADKAPAA